MQQVGVGKRPDRGYDVFRSENYNPRRLYVNPLYWELSKEVSLANSIVDVLQSARLLPDQYIVESGLRTVSAITPRILPVIHPTSIVIEPVLFVPERMTAATEKLLEINVFRGKNYMSWRERIDVFIEVEDLEAALKPRVQSMEQNEYARLVKRLKRELYNRLDDSRILEIKGCATPDEILRKLDTNYLRAGNTTVASLLRQLKYIKYDGKDLESHIAQFEGIATQLALLQHPISSVQLAFDLMDSMPEDKWSLQKANFRANSAERDVTLDEVKKGLRAEHSARKLNAPSRSQSREQSSALYAHREGHGKFRGRGRNSWRGRSSGNQSRDRHAQPSTDHQVRRKDDRRPWKGDKNTKCFKCYQYGHIAKFCPNNKQAHLGATVEEESKTSSYMAESQHFTCLAIIDTSSAANLINGSNCGENVNFNCEWVQEDHFVNLKIVDTPSYYVGVEDIRHLFTHVCETHVSESTIVPAVDAGEFILNSGCTDHMTYVKENLVNVRSADIVVGVAKKGSEIVAEFIGNLETKTSLGHEVTFTKVLYIPLLRRNLVSMTELMLSGYRIEAESYEVRILRNGVLVMLGELRDNLIALKFNIIVPKNVCSEIVCALTEKVIDDTRERWHFRLGHMSLAYVDRLLEVSVGVDKFSYKCSNSFCDSCALGKLTRDPYSKARTRASRVLEWIHADLLIITPRENDIFPQTYILIIVDDFSRYVYGVVLKSKTLVLEAFQVYVNRAKAMHQTSISKLRTDLGSEFTSTAFKKFCDDNGIIQQFSEKNVHQHNGVPEVTIKIIMCITRCIMHHAGVSRHWFDDAIMHAIYLLNRMPCSSIHFKTRIELWRGGQKPDLSKVRVFGCIGYAYEESHKNKLDSRSKPMIVIGKTATGYIMKDLTTGKIGQFRNVLIDETMLFKNLSNLSSAFESIEADKEECDCVLQESGVDGSEAVVIMMTEVFEAEAVEVPKTYEEAMKNKDRIFWEDAVRRELEAMEENNVFEVVKGENLPNIVDTRWVFTRKGPEVFKARLVVRGFKDKHPHTIDEIYAPVPKIDSLRLMLAIAVNECYSIMQMDVVAAFQNSPIDFIIHVQPPAGFECPPDSLWRLKKSLYGLNTAARDWYGQVNTIFRLAGLERLITDPCIFTNTDRSIIVLVYVDDILAFYKNQLLVDKLITIISSKVKLKVIGRPSRFLGV